MPLDKTAREKQPRRKRSGLGGGRGARGPSGRGMQVPGRLFPGGTDLPFPRRGGKWPRQNEKGPGAGETAAAGNGAGGKQPRERRKAKKTEPRGAPFVV